MRVSRSLCTLTFAALALAAAPAAAQVQLSPVASGLSRPLFVGHAGDGLNRLFIVEQDGLVKVLQPGSSTPTVFLDVSSKSSPGESAACSVSPSTRCTKRTAACSSFIHVSPMVRW
jgi:hypothetical protein